jgi:hypothetical protein
VFIFLQTIAYTISFYNKVAIQKGNNSIT